MYILSIQNSKIILISKMASLTVFLFIFCVYQQMFDLKLQEYIHWFLIDPWLQIQYLVYKWHTL